MGYYVAQGGSKLYRIDTSGNITELTLPSGVTIDATARGRFAVLNRQILFVNAASVNLWIDPDGTVRPMALPGPASQPNIVAGSGTGLTGDYQLRESFLVLDADGNVLLESPMGPTAGPVTLANQDLDVSGCAISESAFVNARRQYRTTSGGTVFYNLLDLDGNTQTGYVNGDDDVSLALMPQLTEVKVPPGTQAGSGLELITVWRNRAWAKSKALEEVDYIIASEINKHYSFPLAFEIKPVGLDTFGVTGFIPRRDELVILKRRKVSKIIGRSEVDYEVIDVVEGAGCVAPDSCVVINDVGYWLGSDGIYTIDNDGVRRISTEKVHAWFNTDTYFNRSRFPYAFGRWNPFEDSYELNLAAAGSSSEDRWISYHRKNNEWLGPHLTNAFTPTCNALLLDASAVFMPTMGGADGRIWKLNQTTFRDGTSAIPYRVRPGFHHGSTPDIQKNFLQPSVLMKRQSSGTLTVTPTVGTPSSTPQTSIPVSMTEDRRRMRRLGPGRFANLTFENSEIDVDTELLGYEIPFFELGRR